MTSTGAWNGLGVGLANVWRLADAETRSISPENFTGEKGRGRHGHRGHRRRPRRATSAQGWKVSPSVHIEPGETFVMADIEGPGAIQHIWLTPTGGWRNQILRMYWDDDPQPAVECPVGDFFACGWGEYAQVIVARGVREPGHARSTATGRCRSAAGPHHAHQRERGGSASLYYQITYSLCDVPDDAALLLRAVPAGQPAARRARSSRSSTACRAAASTSARTARGA